MIISVPMRQDWRLPYQPTFARFTCTVHCPYGSSRMILLYFLPDVTQKISTSFALSDLLLYRVHQLNSTQLIVKRLQLNS